MPQCANNWAPLLVIALKSQVPALLTFSATDHIARKNSQPSTTCTSVLHAVLIRLVRRLSEEHNQIVFHRYRADFFLSCRNLLPCSFMSSERVRPTIYCTLTNSADLFSHAANPPVLWLSSCNLRFSSNGRNGHPASCFCRCRPCCPLKCCPYICNIRIRRRIRPQYALPDDLSPHFCCGHTPRWLISFASRRSRQNSDTWWSQDDEKECIGALQIVNALRDVFQCFHATAIP